VDAGPPRLPVDPAETAALAIARARIVDRLARACERSSRDPAEVTLVAVSKTVSVSRLRAAVAASVDLFGENRVQEAAEKAPEVVGARWTLVGPLQSNKARRAVETFESIQTLDSVDLGRRLGRLAGEIRSTALPVLVQVNVDADPGKAGFLPEAVVAALEELVEVPHLELGGLMTIGLLAPEPDEARPTFAVTCRGFPPSAAATQMSNRAKSAAPLRVRLKARNIPSGDHAGVRSSQSPSVICVASPPLTGTTKR